MRHARRNATFGLSGLVPPSLITPSRAGKLASHAVPVHADSCAVSAQECTAQADSCAVSARQSVWNVRAQGLSEARTKVPLNWREEAPPTSQAALAAEGVL